MKYKFEFWKYSHLNTEAAEILLNQRAEEGWNLKKVSFEAMVFEQTPPEKRKRYLVDFVQGNVERGLDEEREAVKEFYEELGWTYAGNGGVGRGVLIFEAPYDNTTKVAYISEAERRQSIKGRLDKEDLIVAFVLLPLLIALWTWQFSRVEMKGAYIGLILFFVVIMSLGQVIPVLSQGIYMAKQSDFAIRLADWGLNGQRYLLAITAVFCLGADIYLIITGQFGNIAPEYRFYIIGVYLSLVAIPLYCIGKGLQLLARQKAVVIIGGFMWILSIVGTVIGTLAVPLQLGWIN